MCDIWSLETSDYFGYQAKYRSINCRITGTPQFVFSNFLSLSSDPLPERMSFHNTVLLLSLAGLPLRLIMTKGSPHNPTTTSVKSGVGSHILKFSKIR